MDIELEHVEVSGRRIALDGTYRQEGEGNTLAAMGGVIAAGAFAGFITGRSGTIPQGRELMATTERDLEVAIPASAVQGNVLSVASLVPQPASGTQPAAAEHQRRPAVVHIGGSAK
jgi:hypothetical protein